MLAALVCAAPALADSSNSSPITIADSATPPTPADLNPSQITIVGQSTLVTNLNVTLHGLSHAFTEDVDVLLVAPNGASVLLMSDAGLGGVAPGSPVDLTFQDGAPLVPQFGSIIAGTFAPTNYGGSATPCIAEPDPFPAPAPAGAYGSTLASLDGISANGAWSLYVVDDCAGDGGLVAQGWSLTLDSAPTAVSVLSFAGRRHAGGVELNWRTASEAGALGFEVWRSSGNSAVKIRTVLVSSHHPSGLRGSSYRVLDRNTRPGARYTYRLRVIERNGARRWASIARVSV